MFAVKPQHLHSTGDDHCYCLSVFVIRHGKKVIIVIMKGLNLMQELLQCMCFIFRQCETLILDTEQKNTHQITHDNRDGDHTQSHASHTNNASTQRDRCTHMHTHTLSSP